MGEAHRGYTRHLNFERDGERISGKAVSNAMRGCDDFITRLESELAGVLQGRHPDVSELRSRIEYGVAGIPA